MAPGSLQCHVNHDMREGETERERERRRRRGEEGRGRLSSNVHMTNFMKGFKLSHRSIPGLIIGDKGHRP